MRSDPWSAAVIPFISPGWTATTSRSLRADKTLAFSNIVILIFSILRIDGDAYDFLPPPLPASLGHGNNDADCGACGLSFRRVWRRKPDRRRQPPRPVWSNRRVRHAHGLCASARRG